MKEKIRFLDAVAVSAGVGLIILSTKSLISPMTSVFLLGLGLALLVVELVRAISHRKSFTMGFLIAFLSVFAFFSSIITFSEGDLLVTREGRFVRVIKHNLEFRIPGWHKLVWISNRKIGSSSSGEKEWIMVNYRSLRLRPAREITVFVKYKTYMFGTVYKFWQEAREKGFKHGDLSPYYRRMVEAILREEIQEAVAGCSNYEPGSIKVSVEKRLKQLNYKIVKLIIWGEVKEIKISY